MVFGEWRFWFGGKFKLGKLFELCIPKTTTIIATDVQVVNLESHFPKPLPKYDQQ